MQESEIVLTTLDNKTHVFVALNEATLGFKVQDHPYGSPCEEHFSLATEAIEALRRRGYDYGEELVRLAVSALRASRYAA